MGSAIASSLVGIIMAKLQGAEAINKEIAGIQSAGAKFDARVQDCALACLEHMDQHGDHTLLVKLYQALPKGSRRGSMAAWIMAFSKLVANTDKATKAEKPFLVDKKKQNKLVDAALTMWHAAGKPEQEPDQVFDINKAVQAILAKAKKAKDKGTKVTGLSAETLAAVQALIA